MQEKKKTHSKTRPWVFTIVGVIITLFNFLIYTLLARTIFNNNELLWLDSMIAYILATFLAYLMHSRITWKERRPTKIGIINFFAWNLTTAIVISPVLTWLFGLITPFYEFAFNISSSIGLPFDYAFIESTGIFCLAALITMVLNYFFYDRLVFGGKKTTNGTASPDEN
ncbi:MAG: GtrA family protein [Candidatus Saccharibacteria bacterium]|nr:GtrA family protein [Candidatus Saccharibacteria bacterium]